MKYLLPPHNHPKNAEDLRRQLGLEQKFPVGFIAFCSALFVFVLFCLIAAGFTFYIWWPLIWK